MGPSAAEKLLRLGIRNQLDLLLHLPVRYQDRTHIIPIGQLSAGDECYVSGEIVKVNVGYGRRRSLVITLDDGGAFLSMRLFHFSPHQRESLRTGVWLRLFGEARLNRSGLEMVHPEYRVFSSEPGPIEPELKPVYRVTAGISNSRIAGWIQQVLAQPPDLHSYKTMGFTLEDALQVIHLPPIDQPDLVETARKRLAFDELLAYYLVMKRRQEDVSSMPARALPPVRQLGKELLNELGFRLTRAQRKTTTDVLNDLAKTRATMRLIQGDVGSGKTVVAAFAAIRAAENRTQTAIMAPTEILAEQHYETFSSWLSPLGIRVGLLTGRLAAAERRSKLNAIADGDDLVIIGTHAIFQRDVVFQDLGLTIVDEQHRFGVHQRMSLRNKGRLPHQLVMTATPIPRTLSMTLYADMELSVIDEMPPGRAPIITSIHANERRDEVVEGIGHEVAAGHQAFWICAAIEESADTEIKAAETVYRELKEKLPHVTVGLIHGRMKAFQKSATMSQFKSGEIGLLVSTTVVEVGVDVPNATQMVIDDPDRLGLAQLHQLRGRIGRGQVPSHCTLLYEAPLTELAKSRLNVMRETNDGFLIAEKDLELRGPGDIMGTRQTGERQFRVSDLSTDISLFKDVVRTGDKMRESDLETVEAIINAWTPPETSYASV
ncbi:MAG: ATP-dependent DNA helicase RecG [Pseudomonadota bacterium]|nr:ATP-dependent DNA helicase RecG [Pseudomonadota bacterium]